MVAVSGGDELRERERERDRDPNLFRERNSKARKTKAQIDGDFGLATGEMRSNGESDARLLSDHEN